MHDALVLVDQTKVRQRQGELRAADEEAVAGLLLELPDGLLEVAAHELRVPIDVLQRRRDDVLLRRVDLLGEVHHPSGPRVLDRETPGLFHHLIRHAAKDHGIGALEQSGGISMQIFVGNAHAVIDTSVERDVDREAKRSHAPKVASLQAALRARTPWGVTIRWLLAASK